MKLAGPELWLQDKPKEVVTAIASRAALRVAVNLPVDWDSDEYEKENLTFYSLRCLIVSSLAAKMFSYDANKTSPSDVFFTVPSSPDSAADLSARSAVLSARSVVYSVALSAVFSVRSAVASSARSAVLSSAFEIWSEVEWDMSFIEQDTNWDTQVSKLVEQKLFNVEGNDWGKKDFEALNALEKQDGFAWWANWLKAMHDGTFRDWDLAHRIATEIPEKIWEQGAIPVAEKIKEFQGERSENREKNLEAQVQILLENSTMTIDTAQGLDEFISQILHECDPKDNERPEFFLMLESIQTISKRISSSTQKGDESELRTEIEELRQQVDKLLGEVAKLKSDQSSFKKFKDILAIGTAQTCVWSMRIGLGYMLMKYDPNLVDKLSKLAELVKP